MNSYGGDCLRYANGDPGSLNVVNASYGPGGGKVRIVYALAPSQFGQILIAATARGVCWLGVHQEPAYLESELRRDFRRAAVVLDDSALRQIREEVMAFIGDSRASLNILLDIRATPFQLAVWRELCAIPRGATRSYGEIARRLGQPGAARAVGHANGSNRLAILIPCHRAIGADGTLTGYRWGLEYKRRLLDYERFGGSKAGS